MAKVTIEHHSMLDAPVGSLLSEIISPSHMLEMPCGGQARCGKCRVIATGRLSPLSEVERACLTEEEIAQGIRLACCARIEGDCTVTLSENVGSQIRLSGEIPAFTLDPVFSHYGAAIDMGTTTLAACLYDVSGKELAQAGAPNPQSVWGADVISRINAALQGHQGELAACIRQGISGLIGEMASHAGISPQEIDYVVITGNTTMLYLLTETDPEELSRAPFTASRLFGETLSAESLDLPCPNAGVYLPRCISSFVGADITTALLASDITSGGGTRMLVDIGTNGEVALWHDDRLLCCSTAAGPAFEGAGLSMGMQGKPGAVDHVSVRHGGLSAHTISDSEPCGLCGSGVIDAVACLLQLKRLDETGLLEEDPTYVAGRVGLTQKDVRMVQLAKSAICAGILTLLHTAGLSCAHVSQLAIAGGFGSYVDVVNAGHIGLLPRELVSRVRVIGNAALSGASLLLLNRQSVKHSELLAAQAKAVDLSANPKFVEEYTNGMFFPT